MPEYRYDKPNRLSKLHDELIEAFGTENVLTVRGTDEYVLLEMDEAIPETEVAAVVAAHDPAPPLEYSGERRFTERVRTTNATPTELVRFTPGPLSVHRALLRLMAVDSGNGAAKFLEASTLVKRLNAGAIIVGNVTVIANHADTAAATWANSLTVSGNDVVITVTGAAGRNIDWLLEVEVKKFVPGGETPVEG